MHPFLATFMAAIMGQFSSLAHSPVPYIFEQASLEVQIRRAIEVLHWALAHFRTPYTIHTLLQAYLSPEVMAGFTTPHTLLEQT